MYSYVTSCSRGGRSTRIDETTVRLSLARRLLQAGTCYLPAQQSERVEKVRLVPAAAFLGGAVVAESSRHGVLLLRRRAALFGRRRPPARQRRRWAQFARQAGVGTSDLRPTDSVQPRAAGGPATACCTTRRHFTAALQRTLEKN